MCYFTGMVKNDQCFARIHEKFKKKKHVKLVGLNTSVQILGGLNPSDKLCNNSHIYCIIEWFV